MYKIEYLSHVLNEDFKYIDKSDIKIILKAIDTKLQIDPIAFGKPLKGTLKNYYRLRVMEYRVIYRIIENRLIVTVIAIRARKDELVYKIANKRSYK